MNPITKPKLAAALAIIVAGALAFHACRKMDYGKDDKSESAVRKKFFTINAGTHPTVASIAASIKRQDNNRNFIPALVKKAGYAIWDKARVMSKGAENNRVTEEEQQVFIPFAPEEEEQTTALLVVKLAGADTLYHLLYGSQSQQYGFDSTAAGDVWNGKEIFRAFTIFDNDIYGHTKYAISDNRLLEGDTDTVGNIPVIAEITDISSAPGGRLKSVYSLTIWISYVVCGECYGFRNGAASRMTTFCCNATYYSGPVTFWIDDGNGDWGWYEPEGGGGGGMGGDPCPGCNWEDTNPCAEPDPNQPQDPCDQDWQPVTDDLPFDPEVFDSLRIDNDIRDSFPCVYRILHDSLFDLNKKVQKIMHDNFFVSQYNHVYFEIDWSMNSANPSVAHTDDHGTSTTINGSTHWTDTIKLNPYYLGLMSKDMLIATIVHETVHAYIWWCWKEYKRPDPDGSGLVSADYLKEHFPLHWELFMNEQLPDTAGHVLMAYNYVDDIYNELYAHRDQSIDSSLWQWVARKLAMASLQHTSAWGKNMSGSVDMTDTCTIKQVLYWAQRNQETVPFPYAGGNPCRVTDSLFRDSLQMRTPCQ